MNPPTGSLPLEDGARDAELILGALEPQQLAGGVVHVRDGAEALECLFQDVVDAVKQVSGFWAVMHGVAESLRCGDRAGAQLPVANGKT